MVQLRRYLGSRRVGTSVLTAAALFAVAAAIAGEPTVASAGTGSTAPPSCVVTSGYGTGTQIPPQVTNVVSPSITVPAGAGDTVADVNVQLWFDNPGGVDVAVRDQNSTGKVADLAGATGTYDAAIFDDQAPGALSGTPPFSGRYRAEVDNALAVFHGVPVGDPWALVFTSVSNQVAHLITWRVIITYAGCTPDSDSDGVPDARDACPKISARTATGCPVVHTGLSVTTRQSHWSGRVKASAPVCVRGRTVRLFRVHMGPDPVVKVATSGATGAWGTSVHLRHGSYYTVVTRRVVHGAADCTTARSLPRRL